MKSLVFLNDLDHLRTPVLKSVPVTVIIHSLEMLRVNLSSLGGIKEKRKVVCFHHLVK